MTARPRVAIVQRYVTHYRVPFFEQLRERLDARGIELELVHGFPLNDDLAKRDTATVSWATTVTNRWLGLGRWRMLWQPAMPHIRGADLMIVEQASARTLNYRMFLHQITGRARLALCGHGRNFKEEQASRMAEGVKRLMSRRVHWWFAYNRLSAQIVVELGYPAERITDVQNAIDTRELMATKRALTPADLAAVRTELDLPERHVGVYVGGMYAEKRLGFLLDAAARVRERIPDFALILIGGGEDAERVRRAAAQHAWVHYLGPQLGTDKVPYVTVADLLLMPGLVGLAVLDSFALDAPIVTTADAPHSPEIDYLKDGRNGVLLGSGTTPQDYADEVARLLLDADALASLCAGCRQSAAQYTIEEMASRFAEGIEAALAAPPIGRRR